MKKLLAAGSLFAAGFVVGVFYAGTTLHLDLQKEIPVGLLGLFYWPDIVTLVTILALVGGGLAALLRK